MAPVELELGASEQASEREGIKGQVVSDKRSSEREKGRRQGKEGLRPSGRRRSLVEVQWKCFLD